MVDLGKYFKGKKGKTIKKVIESLEEVLKDIQGKSNPNIPLRLANKFKDKDLETDVMGIIERLKNHKK